MKEADNKLEPYKGFKSVVEELNSGLMDKVADGIRKVVDASGKRDDKWT